MILPLSLPYLKFVNKNGVISLSLRANVFSVCIFPFYNKARDTYSHLPRAILLSLSEKIYMFLHVVELNFAQLHYYT